MKTCLGSGGQEGTPEVQKDGRGGQHHRLDHAVQELLRHRHALSDRRCRHLWWPIQVTEIRFLQSAKPHGQHVAFGEGETDIKEIPLPQLIF